MAYDRTVAMRYAREWALKRNPALYNFDNNGGDCTNFISQCLRAGGLKQNYAPVVGWFYISQNNRAPAWTSVENLHKYLINFNVAKEVPIYMTAVGDVIQLSFDGTTFGHSLIVTETGDVPSINNIKICTHTEDALDRHLRTYIYAAMRVIHING
jgi:hypothetical protein